MSEEDQNYNNIREILTSLKYPHYVNRFEDEKIDDEIVLLFEEKDFEKLIPEMGIRKQFFLKIRKGEIISSEGSPKSSSSNNNNNHLNSSPSSFTSSQSTLDDTFSDGQSASHESDNTNGSFDGAQRDQLTAGNNPPFILATLMPLYDITRIMESADPIHGKSIVENVLLSRSMTLAQRKVITAAAVNHLRETTVGNYPTKAAKEAMAKHLASVFPFIPENAWYSKHPKKNATGYLEYRIGNLQKSLKKKFGIQTQTSVAPKPSPPRILLLSDEEYNERKQWLKDHREDKPLIGKYMQETFSRRRVEIENSGLSAEEWPCLFSDIHLIQEEFDRLPQGNISSLNIYGKWTVTVSKKILEFCSQQGLEYRDKLNIKCDNITDEGCHIAAASILPFLFSSGAIMVNRKRRKISNFESLSYFCEIFPIGTNIKALCDIEKKRSQPFIILLGNFTTCQFEQFFVMAERKALVCNSFLQAFDTCFKLFYIMKADFPCECSDVWEFFNSFVYSLSPAKSSHLQLMTFISDLI